MKKKYNLWELNWMWKWDNVWYTALHHWIKARLVKPQKCNDCLKNKPLDLANISGEYKRDLNDWEWLCRKCHMIKDGRLKTLINAGNKCAKQKKWTRNWTIKICENCWKETYRYNHEKDKRFCSLKCVNIYQRNKKYA